MSSPWAAIVLVAICLVPTSLSLNRAAPAVGPVGGFSGDPLSQAVSSLESGTGPIGGAGTHCTLGYLAASCSVPEARPLAPSSGGLWWNLTPLLHPIPTPRVAAVMADDVADGYVVLFGGTNLTAYYGDTWKFSDGAWTQLFPSVSPSARVLGGMVYDAADGYILLYGGANTTNQYTETWKFSGGTWTQLFPAEAPPNVEAFGMAYDAADHAVVLFGGVNSTQLYAGGTWEFAHGEWTELSPAISPPLREFPQMAYDPVDGYVVLFGGLNLSGAALADTWRFVGGVWTELTPSPFPSARAAASMVWDPTLGAIVLYGGTNESFEPTDTWLFRGGAWTLLSITTNPGGSLLAQSTYDSEDGFLLLFSGDTKNSGGTVGPITWAFSPIVSAAPSAARTNLDAGLSDRFTANEAGGVGPYSYNWTFGPGRSSAAENPSWVFATAGTYHVNLTVSDFTGTQATGSVTVTVVATLAATIVASANTTTVGSSDTFTASLVGGVGPFAYNWTFGPSATSEEASPSYSFGSSGTATVKLTVTDAAGAESNATLEVKVQAAPSGLSGADVAIIAIVVVVIAALAGFLFWRRKGGSRPAPPPMMPAAPATFAPPPPPPPPPA